jgi:hypothetical protein
MRISKPLRNAFGFEFDLASQPLDYSGLADACFSDKHRGIGALAMTQDFDHLADFFVPSNDRGKLVLSSQLVEADPEMFEIWRELIPAAILFFFLLVTADSGLDFLHHDLAVRSQPL